MSQSGGSPPDDAPPESLTGDFVIVSVVSEYNTENEAEKTIGETMGEVTSTNEPEVAETTYHESAVIQQQPKHTTQTFEFVIASIPDQPQLQTIGTHDQNGNLTNPNKSAHHEAMRFRIYNNEPGALDQYDDAWEFRDCVLYLGEKTYAPGDPGEISITVGINGGTRHGITVAPTGGGGGGGGTT